MPKVKENSAECTREEVEVIREVARTSGLSLDLDGAPLRALCPQLRALLESEAESGAGCGPTEKEILNLVLENSVVLTEIDYLRAASVALSLAHKLAGTDFGTSRQRSFGQKWSDTIQGLLGEIAFRKVISKCTEGRLIPIPDAGDLDLDEALKTDIKWVLFERKEHRELQKRISIKTTKLNGRWLDVPYKQYLHSDAYVLVKVGTNQDTLYSFLAKRGFLSKIINSHLELQDLLFKNEREAAERATENIKRLAEQPIFLLAFISGWKAKEALERPFEAAVHNAERRRAKKITIYSGCGRIPPSPKGRDVGVNGEKGGAEVKFHPIGDFSKANRSVCSVDALEKSLSGLIDLLELWV